MGNRFVIYFTDGFHGGFIICRRILNYVGLFISKAGKKNRKFNAI
jgi:hypothetical protein